MKWFVQVQSWDSYEALLSYEQGLLFEYLLNQVSSIEGRFFTAEPPGSHLTLGNVKSKMSVVSQSLQTHLLYGVKSAH